MTVSDGDLSSPRRSKMDIISDILETAREGASKTQILYRANLSFAGIKEYLPFLVKKGLVIQVSGGNMPIFQSTKKAMVFLKKYKQLTQLVNENKE